MLSSFLLNFFTGSYQGSGSERNIKGPAIGGPFRLIDRDCHLVTDRDLRGNWTLIYFGYTSSPDVGPEEVTKMAKAIDILGSDSFALVSSSFSSLQLNDYCLSDSVCYLIFWSCLIRIGRVNTEYKLLQLPFYLEFGRFHDTFCPFFLWVMMENMITELP